LAIEERIYQQEYYIALRNAFRNHKRVCLQAPTGAGKTIIFSRIAAGIQSRGEYVLILVHRRELIKQTIAKFEYLGISPGVLAAGFEQHPNQPIQIASIQTLARHLDRAPKARVVIVDECHHINSASWSKILTHYNGAYILGCTATPERLDGKGLDSHFDILVSGPSIADLIKQGYLADCRIFTARVPDLSAIKRVAGDFAKAQLAKAMSQNTIIGNAVEHYREHAHGLPAIAFCCTVAHAQLVADQFDRAGYRAASIDGSMDTKRRDAIIHGLSSGRLHIVTSCDLISEGLDVPDVAVAILLRPTQSLTLYLQQVGRALRPKPIPAIILDHAGNVHRHGSPKIHRQWTLEGRPKRLAAERAVLKAERAEIQKRKMHKEINDRLIELGEHNLDAIRLATIPYREALRLCPTRADLERLARLRGYDWRWVDHVLYARRKRTANNRVAAAMRDRERARKDNDRQLHGDDT
jgi:DNA repair protein RadD